MDAYKCLICFSATQGPVYQVSEMMFGSGERFAYTQCPECGTIQQLSPPTNMGSYYPAAYYSFTGLSRSTVPVRWMKKIRLLLYRASGLSLFRPVYGNWLHHLAARESDQIADIGCGNGQLLYEMHASGYKHLSGFDPFLAEPLRVASGLELFKLELHQILGTFQVIMLHHAFEHMRDPNASFAKLASLLQPGGRLLIRVPVSDGEAWSTFREHWVQLDAPRHYFIPSVTGMERLARRYGLELFRTEFDSTSFQFWGSQRYRDGASLSDRNPSKIPSAEQMRDYEQRAKLLNQTQKGDQAAFYFRKPI
ncbi:class I SAM-dependent methyltransferase [Cyclobacterium xiamenense]|jgi:SAM-dependent methyltransferase|uniref:class I SAM-dependent methyltransferase n=1 Tax=Cyclobacterium xiamenense TaxID=1297121 RepID=UPI0012BA0928|nr:class I SAM-dependent methyltransferase [Cyclobacterium xiamenense]